MVKFIFEVSEDFIHESGKVENIEKTAKKGEHGAIRAMVQMIAFNEIEKAMKNGKTEFVVNRDKLDEQAVELYDNTVCDVAFLSHFAKEESAQ